MTQMMRKKGEYHLYRYDPVDFNAEIWEIVDLESSDKPKASKPRKPKPVEPEPVVAATDALAQQIKGEVDADVLHAVSSSAAVEADPDDEFNFD